MELRDLPRLPVSLRIVLESLLRNRDGERVRDADVEALASWKPNAPRTAEIPFVVARVLLQDFTGVPLVVDLAAMRSAAMRAGRDAKLIEPLVPVELVADHSVQVDYFGTPDALAKNVDIEMHRNRERYQFLKWGMRAFDGFRIVPPGFGICHQVNLEYLARGIITQNGVTYPDTLVGADSHTTMVNGLAVVLDELADDLGLAQKLGHRQHEIGRGHAGREPSVQVHAYHVGRQEIHRLAEHGRFGLDAAHAPADHAKAVDHGRVRIRADQRVREVE